MNNLAALQLLHTGGVTQAVEVPADEARRAIIRLLNCHDHVFVVDGSRASREQDGYVLIGTSDLGMVCLAREFDWSVQDLQERSTHV